MINIGYIAFIFSSIAFLPQTYHVYETNHTSSLSIYTLILFLISQVIWFLHSFQNRDIALRISTFINVIIYCYLLYKKTMNDM